MIDHLKSIKGTVETVTAVVGSIKAIMGLMPAEKQKELKPLVLKLEAEQKLVEASFAQKFGIELCQYCWPPEIVRATPETLRQECVNCHRQPPHLEREEKMRKLVASKQLDYNVGVPARQ